MKRKVYVVGGSINYANWLVDFENINNMADADLVMFTGGSDIHPSLYGEKEIGMYTSFNMRRDEEEILQYQRAKDKGLPMIGICRGAQFLTAMSGGKLIQHQLSPGSLHPIYTWDDSVCQISSLHHQAMYPYNMEEDEYKLIAWAQNHSTLHWNGKNQEISDKPFKEAEIVYYPKTRSLCIQGHPEMMSSVVYPDTFEFLDDLVERLIDKTL